MQCPYCSAQSSAPGAARRPSSLPVAPRTAARHRLRASERRLGYIVLSRGCGAESRWIGSLFYHFKAFPAYLKAFPAYRNAALLSVVHPG